MSMPKASAGFCGWCFVVAHGRVRISAPVSVISSGVLELGGALAVLGDDGPAVVPHVPLDRAQVEHRLDGEGHPGLDHGVVLRGRVVVGDHQPGVERRADAVAGEVAHHAIAKTLGIALDHPADDVDLAAGHGRLDAAHHGLVGALDEQPGLLVDVAAEVRGVGVSVDAADEGGDVDVDDVAVLERAVVGDAVADDLVDAGAQRLREV